MTDRFRSPYDGWDVLAKWDSPSYNAQTRAVLRHRLSPPPARALDPAAYATLVALCDRVIPQDDGPDAPPRADIAPWIDAAIHDEREFGTRYDGMPDNPTAWRRGLAALDAEARARHDKTFADLDGPHQDALIRAVGEGDLADQGAWTGLDAQTFLRQTALKQIVETYYAHPKGQSEIGYGGPASPRGYLRLGADRFDTWEAPAGDWDGDGVEDRPEDRSP